MRDLPSITNAAENTRRSSTKLNGFAAVALAFIGVTCGFRIYAAELATPASSACTVTHPKGGIYGNDSLVAILPTNGRFVFRPGGPGFVDDDDGALGIAVGWEFRKKGTILIRGRRLDGSAPPPRAYIPRGYDNHLGGVDTFLVFPTPGCWEITGTLAGESLTFIVEVVKIGDGPAGHTRGPPSGWRVTGGSI